MASPEQDQYDAAHHEALRVTHRIAGMIHGDTQQIAHYIGPVVSGIILRHVLHPRAERRACEHLAEARSPRPAYAVAWQPGIVTCEECVGIYDIPEDDPEQDRCDGCGMTSGEIGTAVTTIGVLVMISGLCRACRAIDFPTQRTPTT